MTSPMVFLYLRMYIIYVSYVSTSVLHPCSIGKGTGYKASELASLDEGHTLAVGGKEIEVNHDS